MVSLRSVQALLALGMACLGCNAIAAKPEAEAVAERSFVARTSRDREATLAFYHDAFYRATSREDWRAMLDAVDAKLGVPQSHSLSSWQVYVGGGAAGTGTYVTLAYEVHYPDASGTETLVLFSPGGAEARIVGHNFDSPAFLTR